MKNVKKWINLARWKEISWKMQEIEKFHQVERNFMENIRNGKIRSGGKKFDGKKGKFGHRRRIWLGGIFFDRKRKIWPQEEDLTRWKEI